MVYLSVRERTIPVEQFGLSLLAGGRALWGSRPLCLSRGDMVAMSTQQRWQYAEAQHAMQLDSLHNDKSVLSSTQGISNVLTDSIGTP